MGQFLFGPFEPDSAGVDVPVLAVAKNVNPLKMGYGPIQALAALSESGLPDRCIGLFFGRASSGGYIVFAGTSTRLYRFQSGAWVDYTRVSGGTYNVPADDYWSFTQYGSLVIACNINDDVQVIDVDTGAVAFSALGGSPPRARYVSVVGDFVVLGCLSANNRKIRNSAINSATGWTLGVDLCDEQEFPDGGRVTGVAGGEFGYVLQEHAVRRMTFLQGSEDLAFRFDRVEKEHGAAAGYSTIATANSVFFLSDDGFYSFGPNGLNPIGSQRVNKWFRSNSDTSRFFSVVAFGDPYAPRIAWAFYNTTSSTNFDRMLIYDWQIDRWSYAEVTAQFWATLVTVGVTLEDLDIYGSVDTGVPYSLDSRVWEGGRPVSGAVDTSGRLAFQEGGTPLDALLTTAPMHLNPNGRARVSEVYPLGVFNDSTLAMRIGRRENMQDAATYTSSVAPSTRSGVARFTATGRVHEMELAITQATGTLWTFVQGLNVMARPDGRK